MAIPGLFSPLWRCSIALGQWQCTPTVPLDEGTHTITATDPAGNVSNPVTLHLTVAPEFATLDRHTWLPIIYTRPEVEFP
ncbi:MAG: hypothetical protein DCC55_32575 [Chloroflexi bacterium]|nr:MAG: hypothetical protein DCC55_32575 [Chloroflexota bacterium]